MPDQITEYEYEERAFLDESTFEVAKRYLDSHALESKIDNKHSYFFVMPDVNVSIASSQTETKIKYKGGQLGLGNGFEEREFNIKNESLNDAISLFTSLLRTVPQESYQFRINYKLANDIEVALKYTHMWGFHLEAERVYSAQHNSIKAVEEEASKVALGNLAHAIGINYIANEEMAAFKLQCEQNILRGEYSPDKFKKKFGYLFGL